MQVKDLTLDELKTLIRETVEETLEEFLPDLDEGKTVKEKFKQQLLEIRKRREKGVRGISTEEVMQRLGLSD
jgi:DNA mismatch repair ATPase MutS